MEAGAQVASQREGILDAGRWEPSQGLWSRVCQGSFTGGCHLLPPHPPPCSPPLLFPLVSVPECV